MIKRRKTCEIRIGTVKIGGKQPVSVQSMCNTDTGDVEKTLDQICSLQCAGCEIARVSVRDRTQLMAYKEIIKRSPLPVVADIHFNHKLALDALEHGAPKVRINPGNIGGKKNYLEILKKALSTHAAVRIGVNSGSLDKKLLKRYGHPTPEALAQSALDYEAIARDAGFENLVVSIKSTDAYANLTANHLFSKKSNVPLHLGITEAGLPEYGAIKSAVGLGALLLQGIGDTIRVSLTGDPVREIQIAYDILKASRRRIISPEVIACPTCGRLQIDLESVASQVEASLRTCRLPITVAVLGCLVNGPGEAAEADVGLAGGNGMGIIFRKGKEVARVRESDMVEALLREIHTLETHECP